MYHCFKQQRVNQCKAWCPMPRLKPGWHGHSFYNFWGTVVHFNHLRTEQLHGKAGCVLFNQRLIYNLPAIRATICLCCGLVCPQGAGGCGVKMQCCVSPCFSLWFQCTWLAQSILITLPRLFLRRSNGFWEVSIEQAFYSSLAHSMVASTCFVCFRWGSWYSLDLWTPRI